MAEIKISALGSAASLTGTEAVPVVQSGTTKKTTTADIANLLAGAVNAVSNAVSVERVARQADVDFLSNTLSNVISAGGGGTSVTSNYVSQVAANAQSAIDVVSVAVDAVSDAVSKEISNRISADNAASARTTAGASVHGAQTIADAFSNRISATVAGANSVTSTELSAAGATLSLRIDTVSVSANAISAALVVETNNRASAVNAVSAAHNVLSVQVQAVVASAAATSVRVDAVSLAHTGLSNVVSGIIAAGGAGVSVISQEVSAVSAQANSAINVVSAALVDEASIRTSAVNAVSQRLSVETVDRISVDNLLSNRISTVSNALSAETAARLSADVAFSNLLSAAAVNTFSAFSTLSAAAAATSVRLDTLSTNYTSLVNRVSANSATGGGGGVTTDFVSQAVSALNKASARTSGGVSVQGLQSAINALSFKISVLAAGGAVVSVTSTKLSVVNAALTSAINVVSAVGQANSVLGAQHTASLAALSLTVSTLGTHVEAASAAATSADIHANAASAAATSVGNALNTLCATVSTLAATLSNAQSAGDVISAGIGIPQLRMVSGGIDVISASGLTKVSGLSVSVAVGGIYQIKAVMLHTHSAQGTNGYGFGVSSPAATAAGGKWMGYVSVGNSGISINNSYFNQAGFGSITHSATPTASATVYRTELDMLLVSVAAGTVQLKARTSAATVGAIHIQIGSYIQAFRIG